MATTVKYADIGKSVSDLLGRDYPVGTVKLEVTTKTPNGVSFTVNGSQDSKSGLINGELKAKYADYKNGLTVTNTWTTKNVLSAQVELENKVAKGLKLDINASLLPAAGQKAAKVGVNYKQPGVFSRATVDLLKGPSFSGDVVFGREGFLVGAEVGYDVPSGNVTRYSTAVGYSAPQYAVALHANAGMSVFAASFFHRVNPDVEVGAKATWDSKTQNAPVALELGTKYFLDKDTFVKTKIDNAGRLGLGYTQRLRAGVKVSLGGSFDTSRLNESAHKVGISLVLEN
ncbi:eukaryotic porin/Tom40 [Thamnocephalis sphaerospora]|uniref:Eukaryotic porin/Tom40 n=1 Tax=Thamnocephalis sphaerospora TaxID=78915 RepID=A0A4P9XX05_9FUNG|nr:eukaryotic porin/Tom40 [Thamnocephalis sphaerospora]|eukprot:RKP10898.1 eukaryotic porin/Tom40 [Thamnocephalis sphaerospora]